MRKLRAVLVDDDHLALEVNKALLNLIDEVDIVAVFTNPVEALKGIPLIDVDVVILDVMMPTINGIMLATELQEQNGQLEFIFITAYDDYAIEAFQLNALHYILKPVDLESLKISIHRLATKSNREKQAYQQFIKIKLFGGLRFNDAFGEIKVKWITSKAEELFVLLLLNRHIGISKWRIIEFIWGDVEGGKGQQNLYTTLFRMKKALSEAGLCINVESSLGKYCIKMASTVVDIEEFEYITQIPLDEFLTNEQYLYQLLDIYQGDLFGEQAYLWGLPYREHYYDVYFTYIDAFVNLYKQMDQESRAERLMREASRRGDFYNLIDLDRL